MSDFYANLFADEEEDVICESPGVIVMPKLLRVGGVKKEEKVEDEPTSEPAVNTNCSDDKTSAGDSAGHTAFECKPTSYINNDDTTESTPTIDAAGPSAGPSIADETAAAVESNDVTTLSRRARRRLAKRQQMLEMRPLIRKKEKDRRKERRREQRESGQLPPRVVPHKMCDSKCQIRVAVDMAYEELMTEDLTRRTLSQLAFCYASNRKVENPLQFYITNMRGHTKAMFESREGNTNWDINVVQEPLAELWTPSDIVYLTADSENVLERLDDAKVYVIGGLIDYNAHKGICLKRAVEQGFSHARLPIDDFVKMKTRKVLTINHVFDILVQFSVSKNWEEAFFSVIPTRKGVERLEKPELESCRKVPAIEINSETLDEVVNGDNCASVDSRVPEAKRSKIEENAIMDRDTVEK